MKYKLPYQKIIYGICGTVAAVSAFYYLRKQYFSYYQELRKKILPLRHNINCEHYMRGCQLLSPCCNELFDCRLCHDVIKDEQEKNIDNAHTMNIHDIQKIMCKKCYTLQDISQYCSYCHECMGNYFCDVCRFYDNRENKDYFHCVECGICRQGKKEDYMHCDSCGRCFIKGHEKNCKGINITSAECPICLENLNTSTRTSFPLLCGHMIHIDCFHEYAQTDDKCPLCCKKMYENEEGDNFLRFIKRTVRMPEELENMEMEIMCNDCGEKNKIKFHFAGLECPGCKSFNTKQI